MKTERGGSKSISGRLRVVPGGAEKQGGIEAGRQELEPREPELDARRSGQANYKRYIQSVSIHNVVHQKMFQATSGGID